MVCVPLFFSYPMIGFFLYNQIIEEINKDERDEQGLVIKESIEFVWKQKLMNSLAFVLGPWIFKFKFLYKYQFSYLGFRKFTTQFYSNQSDEIIEKYFRYSMFWQNILLTIPDMIIQFLISYYF